MAYFLGVDLGGTYIKIGVLDDQGRLLGKAMAPTGASQGPQVVCQAMADAAGAVVRQAGLSLAQIAALGIGAPGPLDLEAGKVRVAPNMPGWEGFAIRDQMARLIGRPTVLENDANAAAFGEFVFGAGKDSGSGELVMLTLGTGIGSGVIVNGKIVHGATGMGGEGGHILVHPGGRQCGCGQRGCLEAYSSATNTAARAVELLGNRHSSSLQEIFKQSGRTITAKDVFDAARAGDVMALGVVQETAMYLGIGCVTICRLLDSRMIVLGGGMIQAGDWLLDLVRSEFRRHSWTVAQDHVRIVAAQLGNDAGVIGAAAVAQEGVAGRLPVSV